jgi:hypothetical protein
VASSREPAPTYRYAVRIYKGGAVLKAATIRAKKDDDADVASQKLMQWEGGDSYTCDKKGKA